MIEQFAVMKPKKADEIPMGEQYIYQQKIDGGNAIVNIELPNVDVIHARTFQGKIIWNKRTYRYPELVTELQQGISLKDNCTYIGELTALDGLGIGRHWLFLKRQLENTFQIRRMSKILPICFYPHHIVREGDDLLFDVPYIDILRMLNHNVKEGDCVKPIPTFETPDKLLEQKGLIEGIVIKDRHGIYHKGKRSGWKKKFLKEQIVKFVKFENQDIGIKMVSNEGKPVHLAGNRVDIVTTAIQDKGYCMCEIEFYAETDKGYRDCSVKRVLDQEIEVDI